MKQLQLNKIYLKYPMRLGDTIYKSGTEVTLAKMKNIKVKFPNAWVNGQSDMVAIEIDDVKCCVVLKKQLSYE
jgi:hypothetical protein